MLVLSRKEGESFHIGSNITIKVLETQRSRVRIGIDAPNEVVIRRDEVELAEEESEIYKVKYGFDGMSSVKINNSK